MLIADIVLVQTFHLSQVIVQMLKSVASSDLPSHAPCFHSSRTIVDRANGRTPIMNEQNELINTFLHKFAHCQ